MGDSDDLRRELEEIEETLQGLPEDSTLRRHLETRRDELVSQLDAEPDPSPPSNDIASDGSAPPSGQPSAKSRPLGAYLAAAVVVVVAIAGGIIWWNSNYESVPDVVNEERGFASGVLRSAGFEIEVVTEPDPDVAEGQVLDQDPAPGSRLRTGESVTLTVAELPTYNVRGAFTLRASTDGPDNNCQGSGGYSDIRSGVTVTAKDGDGRTLATGRLDPGTRESNTRCVFAFEIRDVPQAEFYSFEVGRRGELTYTHAEMESLGWIVGFELG